MMLDRQALSDPIAAATTLVRQYGEDADVIAMLAAAEAAAYQDRELLALWDNVILAIARLVGREPGGATPVH